jgi:glucose-6-phosphate 1-dehydrogenase
MDVTFVLLGATGDLTKRKLIPAIYHLLANKAVDKVLLVGVARRKIAIQSILKEAKTFISKPNNNIWQKIVVSSYYQQLDFYDEEHYAALGRRLENLEAKHELSGNRLFYLATLPQHFDTITLNLSKTKIARQTSQNWSRLVYEKPFGNDLASARKINSCISRAFREDQVYRIDHYLGKELVGNIAILRFTNRVFEPLWNRHHLESVQVTFDEDIGLAGRGNFYDKYGALKDVVQNHVLQILALIAMESPQKLTGKFIRDEKAKVLKKIKVSDVLLGQAKPYRKEPKVNPKSHTETFSAIKLNINNNRWRGVPFYIRAGKYLHRKEVSIHLKFKPIHCLLTTTCPSDTNYLTIRVNPNEGFTLELFAKVPGQANHVQSALMDHSHDRLRQISSPEAYQVLLHEVILGNQSLFVRDDEIEHAWKVIDSIKSRNWKVFPYPAGSPGPKELSLFEKKHKMRWR